MLTIFVLSTQLCLARVAEGKDDGLNQGSGLPAKEQGFILPCCLTPLLGKPVDAGGSN